MTDVQQYKKILILAYKSKELTQEDFNDTLNHFENLVRLEEVNEIKNTLNKIF